MGTEAVADPSVFLVALLTSTLGILSCGIIFTMSCRFRSLRGQSESMVSLIGLANFAYNARGVFRASVWESGHSRSKEGHSFLMFDDGCAFEALYAQFWSSCALSLGFFWLFDFAVRVRTPLASSSSRVRWFHGVTWPFATLSTLAVLATGQMDRADDGMCSVQRGSLANLVLLIPLVVAQAVTLWMCWWVQSAKSSQFGLTDTVRAREVLIKRHMLYVTAFFLSWVMEICYRFRTVVTRSAVSHEIESAHLAMLHLQPVILLCARALDPTVQILLQDAPNSAVLTSSAVMRHKDTGPASRPLLLAVFSQSGLMADEDDVITEDGDPDGNVGNEHVASLYAPPTLPGSVSAPIPILTTISPSSLPVWNGSPRQRVEKSSVPSSSVVEFASISKGSINSNVPLLTFTPPLTPSNASATSPRLVPLSPSAAQVAAALDGHGPRSLSVYTHRPVTPSVPVPTPKPTASIRTTQPRRSIQLNPERKLQEELGMCLLSGLLQSVQRDDHAFCTGEPMVHDAHLRREHSRRAATFDESAAPVIRSTSSTPAVHSADGAIPRTVSTPSGSESEPAIMLEFDKASRLETLYLQLVSGEGDAAETTTQCFEFYTLFPVGFSSIRRQCRKDSVLHSQQLLYDAALRELAPVGILNGDLTMSVSTAGSGAFFIQSSNFIVKTITPSEVHSLLKMLGTYIRHLTSHPDTLLGRILGCFAVKVSTARRVYAILQENVFSTQPFPRSVRMPAVAHSPHVHIFDLKGSTVDRVAAAGARVLKDSDFVRLYPRGVCVATSTSELKALQDRVEADVSFFRGEGIMDYSLLLGVGTPVDGDNPPVVIGIIDYLQRYDVRKRLERGFKSLVHASLDLDISAVSPDVYAQRFLAFVQQSTRAEVQITDV